MPIAYRLAKQKHSRTASQMMSGIGGLFGSARWHTQGHRMVYASSVASLATLEIVVNETGGMLLPAYRMIKIDIPDSVIERSNLSDLPPGWNVQGPSPLNVRQWGDTWYDSFRSCVLCIPSVILPSGITSDEVNYLINPEHNDFANIDILDGPLDFPFDPRIKS